MNRLILTLVVVGGLGAAIFLATHHRAGDEQKAADSTTGQSEVIPPPPLPAATAEQAPEIPVHAVKIPVVVSENTQPVPLAPEIKTNDDSALKQTIDFLASPESSFEEKQAAWKKLKESGVMDRVIAELRQRAAGDPTVAEYQALLGQAMLQSISTNADFSTRGILALGADRSFDEALKIDPDNWEARYYKAASLSRWPAELNKGDEVIQQFTDLIQLQEKSAAQPQFVRSYILLGDQYQKAGKADSANQVWQRGLALFPGDKALTKRLTGQP